MILEIWKNFAGENPPSLLPFTGGLSSNEGFIIPAVSWIQKTLGYLEQFFISENKPWINYLINKQWKTLNLPGRQKAYQLLGKCSTNSDLIIQRKETPIKYSNLNIRW